MSAHLRVTPDSKRQHIYARSGQLGKVAAAYCYDEDTRALLCASSDDDDLRVVDRLVAHAKPVAAVAARIPSAASTDTMRDCGHSCGSSTKRLRCCTCSLSNPAVSNQKHRSHKRFRRRLCAACNLRQSHKVVPAAAPVQQSHKAVSAAAAVRGRAAWLRGRASTDSGSDSAADADVPVVRPSDACPVRRIGPGHAARAADTRVSPAAVSHDTPSTIASPTCLTCESNELFVSSDIRNAVVCTTCHSAYPEGTFPLMTLGKMRRLHRDHEVEIRSSMQGFHSRGETEVPSAHVKLAAATAAATASTIVAAVGKAAAQVAIPLPSKALTQVVVPPSLTFLSQSLLEELSCTVCLEPFTDPLTLQCGHSVCKACSFRLLKAYKGPGVDCVSCPVCRAITASASKLNVSTELAFVIAVIKSWAIQQATSTTTVVSAVPVPMEKASTVGIQTPPFVAATVPISLRRTPLPAIADSTSASNVGFIVIDGHSALFGVVQGCDALTLHKVLVPSTHPRRGGQAQVRFVRARLEQRQAYLSKVADLAATHFLSDGEVPSVRGLVLAGPAELKGVLAASPLLDARLAGIVLKVVDTADAMEDGFQEAIMLCKDVLE